MAWDFSTEPEYAEKLAWAREFVREECEPLDLVVKESHDLADPVRQALIPPLQAVVKARGLWATHLGPHLGGPGYGQVKLGLLNEILGRSVCAPIVFGSQAPDSGNSEILAHYGTPELKERYLEPLLDNRIVSAFSMTEPQGGADPKIFTTTAALDGDEWVINGEKWFSVVRLAGLLPHRDGRDRPRGRALSSAIPCSSCPPRRPASTSCAPSASDTSRWARATRATSATRTCGFRPTTCSARVAAPSWSHRLGSVAAVSTTPCAPSGSSDGSSTCCASGRCPATPRARCSATNRWYRR